MAKDLSFMKMPDKGEDEAMMDEELVSEGDSTMSESGIDLSGVTDEELMRECEKRGMSVEAGKEDEGKEEEGEEEEDEEAEGEPEEDKFQFPSGMED